VGGFNILFIVPYPLSESPSQRFRFEQYFQILTRAGYRYDVHSFLDSENWQLFFKPGNYFEKCIALTKGFINRFFILFKSRKYDFVFIHREASPAGPPIFEWLLARSLKKKIIYDFDDAIWITDRISESKLLRLLKWRSKVSSTCYWSYKVSCGNEYLQRYASQFNANAIVNPTTIETDNTHNQSLHRQSKEPNLITIGWTGTHSTLKYLMEIETVLTRILNGNPHVAVTIIADKKPSFDFAFTFIPWSKDKEIDDLMTFDIGIMPLPDDEWSQGKCGFKILQYMALQIPAVASPVGVNSQIIEHSISGFLPDTSEEWYECLQRLIEDDELRKLFGDRGREIVEKRYSVNSNADNFLSLFA
jgi:glycosyltransferase involved in cell wall biosynthesis